MANPVFHHGPHWQGSNCSSEGQSHVVRDLCPDSLLIALVVSVLSPAFTLMWALLLRPPAMGNSLSYGSCCVPRVLLCLIHQYVSL